jgi:uncharacterized membrane protein
MRLASYVTLSILSVAIVGYAIAVYGFLPLGVALHPDMRATFEANRIGIYAHIFAAVFALALGPFQFSAKLRTRHLALHRWLGRLYLGVGVLVGGVSGLFMATKAFGGLTAHSGFAILALGWLYTGLRAYTAIRAGNIAAHRHWMFRNFALTFAAVTLRIWLPLFMAAGITFEVGYPLIAWLSWVPNLFVAELLFRQSAKAHGIT